MASARGRVGHGAIFIIGLNLGKFKVCCMGDLPVPDVSWDQSAQPEARDTPLTVPQGLRRQRAPAQLSSEGKHSFKV